MYIFNFNSKLGGKDVRVWKGTVEKTYQSRFHGELVDHFAVRLEGVKKKYDFVLAEEGAIKMRSFWLEELDYERAEQIINEYEKGKYLELKKKLEKLEES